MKYAQPWSVFLVQYQETVREANGASNRDPRRRDYPPSALIET